MRQLFFTFICVCLCSGPGVRALRGRTHIRNVRSGISPTLFLQPLGVNGFIRSREGPRTPNTALLASSADAGIEIVSRFDDVVRPVYDRRNYRLLQLSDGRRALIVSDPVGLLGVECESMLQKAEDGTVFFARFDPQRPPGEPARNFCLMGSGTVDVLEKFATEVAMSEDKWPQAITNSDGASALFRSGPAPGFLQTVQGDLSSPSVSSGGSLVLQFPLVLCDHQVGSDKEDSAETEEDRIVAAAQFVADTLDRKGRGSVSHRLKSAGIASSVSASLVALPRTDAAPGSRSLGVRVKIGLVEGGERDPLSAADEVFATLGALGSVCRENPSELERIWADAQAVQAAEASQPSHVLCRRSHNVGGSFLAERCAEERGQRGQSSAPERTAKESGGMSCRPRLEEDAFRLASLLSLRKNPHVASTSEPLGPFDGGAGLAKLLETSLRPQNLQMILQTTKGDGSSSAHKTDEKLPSEAVARWEAIIDTTQEAEAASERLPPTSPFVPSDLSIVRHEMPPVSMEQGGQAGLLFPVSFSVSDPECPVDVDETSPLAKMQEGDGVASELLSVHERTPAYEYDEYGNRITNLAVPEVTLPSGPFSANNAIEIGARGRKLEVLHAVAPPEVSGPAAAVWVRIFSPRLQWAEDYAELSLTGMRKFVEKETLEIETARDNGILFDFDVDMSAGTVSLLFEGPSEHLKSFTSLLCQRLNASVEEQREEGQREEAEIEKKEKAEREEMRKEEEKRNREREEDLQKKAVAAREGGDKSLAKILNLVAKQTKTASASASNSPLPASLETLAAAAAGQATESPPSENSAPSPSPSSRSPRTSGMALWSVLKEADVALQVLGNVSWQDAVELGKQLAFTHLRVIERRATARQAGQAHSNILHPPFPDYTVEGQGTTDPKETPRADLFFQVLPLVASSLTAEVDWRKGKGKKENERATFAFEETTSKDQQAEKETEKESEKEFLSPWVLTRDGEDRHVVKMRVLTSLARKSLAEFCKVVSARGLGEAKSLSATSPSAVLFSLDSTDGALTPMELDVLLEGWLENFRSELEEMGEEDLINEQMKVAEEINRESAVSSFREFCRNLFREVHFSRFDFDAPQRQARGLIESPIPKANLLDFFDLYLKAPLDPRGMVPLQTAPDVRSARRKVSGHFWTEEIARKAMESGKKLDSCPLDLVARVRPEIKEQLKALPDRRPLIEGVSIGTVLLGPSAIRKYRHLRPWYPPWDLGQPPVQVRLQSEDPIGKSEGEQYQQFEDITERENEVVSVL
uniref:Peptidase M16 middle/third domain-containing protein n=1 Tax=Chromera velia CCMP2878 TaxID=1169474 RepID=A0A0G4G928_9ALVE|eukprot:Cvel_605.t1-p1 / transcript=Cvel_605.t1 / gene=Cvel_605 / organism=Chromera_velia_CCMP2878 / gene_product=hypothetical protein / transcript_product=hypothetical protein / location=Cvel_scaffold18:196266-203379(-) / protein_length=1268 / sequence_SO=supercontig / SO=protein_coding / is_pseudo=false